MIWGDYHIHTSFSGPWHAIGTPQQLCSAAKQKGLKQIGLSDHGLRHISFGTSIKKVKILKKQIEEVNASQSDVKLLLGIESNIFCSQGLVDLQNIDRGLFDFVIAGFHKLVWGKNFLDICKFNLPALFGAKSSSAIKRNTKAYINAIKTQKIDIISHPCYAMPIDIKEVGKAAADFGVMMELNGKRISMTDSQIFDLVDCGVQFIANSDAHTPEMVGQVDLPLSVIDRLNIDKSRVANWEKTVQFIR